MTGRLHWIVLSALAREPGYDSLIDALRRRGSDFTVISKQPHAVRLDPLDPDGCDVQEVLDRIDGPVMVLGTTSMREVSLARDWTPGYVDAPTMSECLLHWGDLMLNHPSLRTTLGGMAAPTRETFIRPDAADKGFNGRLIPADRFAGWRDGLLDPTRRPRVDPATPVIVAEPRRIWAEYRCILVDGAWAAGSRFRTSGRIAYSSDVGTRISRFAEDCAAVWNPQPILCIDVADTPDGLRVVEANAPSSAGFYAMRMDDYVAAVEDSSIAANGGYAIHHQAGCPDR